MAVGAAKCLRDLAGFVMANQIAVKLSTPAATLPAAPTLSQVLISYIFLFCSVTNFVIAEMQRTTFCQRHKKYIMFYKYSD